MMDRHIDSPVPVPLDLVISNTSKMRNVLGRCTGLQRFVPPLQGVSTGEEIGRDPVGELSGRALRLDRRVAFSHLQAMVVKEV
jgi:hypothetical protein